MRSVLPRSGQQKVLVDFLNWLLNPSYFPIARPSQTKDLLKKIRREVKHLTRLADYLRQSQVILALAQLEDLERKLVQQRESYQGYRTYSSSILTRKAPKGLGNIEETERLFVARLVVAKLHPDKNPHQFLEEELAQRGVFRTQRAIQMRVRRFDEFLERGQYFSCSRIVEQHYSIFKSHLVLSERRDIWTKAKVPLPAKHAKILARLMIPSDSEMRALRKLCPRDLP